MSKEKTMVLINGQLSQESANDMIKDICKNLINFYKIQAWITKERFNGNTDELFSEVENIKRHKEELLCIINGASSESINVKMTIEITS